MENGPISEIISSVHSSQLKFLMSIFFKLSLFYLAILFKNPFLMDELVKMHHSKLCKECSICSALCQMISSALGERFEQGCWQMKVLLVCCKIVIYSFLFILTKHALYMEHWKLLQEEGGLFYFMLSLWDRVASAVLLH